MEMTQMKSGDDDVSVPKMEEEDEMPPDEHRCCQTDGKTWRCKNFRMNHGAAADDDTSVPKTKFCENHYYGKFPPCRKKRLLKMMEKKTSGNGEIRALKRGKKVTEEDEKVGIQQITSDDITADEIVEGGSAKFGDKKKNVERTERSKELKSLTKPVVETGASKWRRMITEGGRFVDDTSNLLITCDDDTADAIKEGGSAKFGNKKNVERTERSGQLKSLTKSVVETRASKRRRMITEGVRLDDKTSNQQATHDNCDSDTIIECGSANTRRKRKNVERTKRSGELGSLTRAKEGVVELENLEHYKIKCLELLLELERKKEECTKLQGKLAEVKETRKTAETEWTPADATASWEKMFSYLESRLQRKENGNSTMGCVESRLSNLESLFLRMESKYLTMAGFVESGISKLESLVLRMENENSTMGCSESRISKLESIVQRCVELRHPENIEFEVLGLQKGVTGNGEKQRDKNKRSKPDAETSSRGRKDSHMYEWKTKEKVLNAYDVGVNKHHESESEFPKYSAMSISSRCLQLSVGGENVEEGNGRGCSDVRPFQHGSSFQDQLDMSKKLFANLVSDDGGKSFSESEDSDSSGDSKNSLGDLMDMLAMKYRRNRNDDKEMKWKSEADMLSSFEEDPELCMRAVCALHRQQISEDKISEKGLFYYPDVLRITTLANFLMEEDCKGDLKKSLRELEIFDSKGVADCKRMARRYSIQLFSVYRSGKDPFFLPATTAK